MVTRGSVYCVGLVNPTVGDVATCLKVAGITRNLDAGAAQYLFDVLDGVAGLDASRIAAFGGEGVCVEDVQSAGSFIGIDDNDGHSVTVTTDDVFLRLSRVPGQPTRICFQDTVDGSEPLAEVANDLLATFGFGPVPRKVAGLEVEDDNTDENDLATTYWIEAADSSGRRPFFGIAPPPNDADDFFDEEDENPAFASETSVASGEGSVVDALGVDGVCPKTAARVLKWAGVLRSDAADGIDHLLSAAAGTCLLNGAEVRTADWVDVPHVQRWATYDTEHSEAATGIAVTGDLTVHSAKGVVTIALTQNGVSVSVVRANGERIDGDAMDSFLAALGHDAPAGFWDLPPRFTNVFVGESGTDEDSYRGAWLTDAETNDNRPFVSFRI